MGFEPTVGCPITSFQDWLLKPLGHLSMGQMIPFAGRNVKGLVCGPCLGRIKGVGRSRISIDFLCIAKKVVDNREEMCYYIQVAKSGANMGEWWNW